MGEPGCGCGWEEAAPCKLPAGAAPADSPSLSHLLPFTALPPASPRLPSPQLVQQIPSLLPLWAPGGGSLRLGAGGAQISRASWNRAKANCRGLEGARASPPQRCRLPAEPACRPHPPCHPTQSQPQGRVVGGREQEGGTGGGEGGEEEGVVSVEQQPHPLLTLPSPAS